MICRFVGVRQSFIQLVADKLGSEFEFIPASASPDELTAADIVAVGVSTPEDLDILRAILGRTSVPVIAILPAPVHHLTLKSISEGAFDYFIETDPLAELRMVLARAAKFRELNREIGRLRSATNSLVQFDRITGADPKMLAIFSLVSKIAPMDTTVLITGETGTGKELIANTIHEMSSRSSHPFVAVGCASLPETLIEAELFGHEKGAFTGAAGVRKGRFEAVGEGTIFLDEIGDLSLTMQVKLLRVLQERRFERLGSNVVHMMRARLICATHRDLKAMVRSGEFRADLYYRLDTIEIELPALRERREDIALLAYQFLQQFAEHHQKNVSKISPSALGVLKRYAWPGNVRELQHVIERAVVIADRPEIGVEHLSADIMVTNNLTDFAIESVQTYDDEMRSFKRKLIMRSLELTGNNKVQAAKALGISRSSLHRIIDELKLAS